MSLRIGYIGLGSLGSAIFPHLVEYSAQNHLPAPIVWNRSQDKYTAINKEHPDVVTAKEVIEVVEQADVIFTCLVNDTAVEEVYDKLVKGMNGRKVIFSDQTTLKVSTAGTSPLPLIFLHILIQVIVKIKEKVEKAGGIYITNVVFGQPAAARAKQLVCILAGQEEGREKLRPIVDAIGKKTIDVGDDNGKGQLVDWRYL